MKKVLSFLMVCVFSVVFTGVLIGCDASSKDDGPAVNKQTDVGQEETEIVDDSQ